jgi:hypothetical protein
MHEDLVRWFLQHQRLLPWRSGYHPYHVWISEVMLAADAGVHRSSLLRAFSHIAAFH